MDQREYITYIAERKKANLETIRRKSSDYAPETDPFWNFRLCEVFGICTVEEGLLVRILDKFARVVNKIKSGTPCQVEDEDLHNTLGDSSNYCDILDAYMQQKALDAEKNKEDMKAVAQWFLENEIEWDRVLEEDEVQIPVPGQYVSERGHGEGI